MPPSRHLAAIMFTDIAGYTALMGRDEELAFALLEQSRTIQKPIIQSWNGTWVKGLGDGVLASFPGVADAVLCAAEIQKASRRVAGLQLRIGLHLGDIVFENNDVFGDGVNIASRLQAIAPIGGTWISGTVYKALPGKNKMTTKFIGERQLKNVSEPVLVYELTPIDPDSHREPSVLTTASAKSIAVLAFVNMSADTAQDYFSDGVSEEITNILSGSSHLKVVGRTSTFQFKGKNEDLRVIGEKLNVRYVLEGSVRHSGNRIRITSQLVDVQTGFHLWSEKYDRVMDDVFEVQDEIAKAIAREIQGRLDRI